MGMKLNTTRRSFLKAAGATTVATAAGAIGFGGLAIAEDYAPGQPDED